MAQCRSNKKNQILKYILNKETPEEAFEPDTEEEALLELIARKVKSGYYGANVSDELIEQFITEYLTEHPIEAVEIANNLTTATTGKALDATQGKALKDLLDALSERIDNLPTGGGTGSDVDLSEYAKKTDLHSHSNKGVLDKLSDNNGTLQYNGSDITGGSGSTADVPVATTSTAGKVKPDGTTITVTSDGTISATATTPDLSNYQTKTDNSLTTTAKTIVGAINEVKQTASAGIDSAAITNAVNSYMAEHPVSAEVGDGSVTEKKLATELKDSLYNIKYSGNIVTADYTFSSNAYIGWQRRFSVHPKLTEDIAITEITLKGSGTVTFELWEILEDNSAKLLRVIDTLDLGPSRETTATYVFASPFIIRSNQMLFVKGFTYIYGSNAISNLVSENPNFTDTTWGHIYSTTDTTAASYYTSNELIGIWSTYKYYKLSDGYSYTTTGVEQTNRSISQLNSLDKQVNLGLYVNAFNDNFTEISSNYTNTDNAWSLVEGGGVTTTTTEKELVLNKKYCIDRRFVEFRMSFKSDSVVDVRHHGYDEFTVHRIDVANKKFSIIGRFNNICSENTFNMDIIPDEDYIIRYGIDKENRWYSITNYKTGETESFKEIMPGDKWTWMEGLYKIKLQAGSGITIKNMAISILNNPDIYWSGDSITLGFGTNEPSCRYTTLLRNDIPKMVIASEVGAGFTMLGELIENEIKICKPKIVVVCFGANDSIDSFNNESAGYKTYIDKIEALGIPVYINYNTCHKMHGIVNEHVAKNKFIKTLGKKGARFDIATAIDNIPTGETQRTNTDLFLPDATHPNEAGHKALYERVKADLPELFM